MPNSMEGIRTAPPPRPTEHAAVACPFCGLHCDDLGVRSDGRALTVTANGCERAKRGFEAAPVEAVPKTSGQPVSLAEAVARAADLISAATLPLFGGLGTDVEGMRAVLALADRAGGVVDHAASAAMGRNMGVLQTKGWFMSTLTETRNRADLVIIVAADLAREHPRFFERIVSPPAVMFEASAAKRTVVLIGCGSARASVSGARIGDVVDIACPPADVPELLGHLRAILKDAPTGAPPPGGVSPDVLQDLARRCRQAHYGVIAWAPHTLDFPGADLAVQMITDIVRDLNKTTRFAGLSLGGNDGAVSAASVCSWQSGYPLRVSYASGAPDYDPYRFDIARMLTAGEGDLLIWISSFGPEPFAPPETDLPTIVIGAPGIRLAREPDVFIPVGTPGLDHAGRLIRCDSVVSLPLKALRSSGMPVLPDVAHAIEAALKRT